MEEEKRLLKIGEENINNFGSKMVIIEYRNNKDIDILFPEYNWVTRNRRYIDFKKGKIKCPYEPRYFGKGYLGEGKYKVSKNGKKTKCYDAWYNMLTRCFDEKYKERQPTYDGVTCEDELLNFQIFTEWYYDNYYEVEGERMELDKDILVKGNKIYSRDTCVFVPQSINKLFVKNDINRGELPIGVLPYNNKYIARLKINGKNKTFSIYDTPEEAFMVYKYEKEKHIKQVADEYKDKIPMKLYEAMYKYEVDIDD